MRKNKKNTPAFSFTQIVIKSLKFVLYPFPQQLLQVCHTPLNNMYFEYIFVSLIQFPFPVSILLTL